MLVNYFIVRKYKELTKCQSHQTVRYTSQWSITHPRGYFNRKRELKVILIINIQNLVKSQCLVAYVYDLRR